MTGLIQTIQTLVLKLSKRQRLVELFLVAFFGFVFFLSEQTGEARPPLFYGDDKVAHFIMYTPAGFLLALGLSFLEQKRAFVYAVTILLFWGLFDECHQGLIPGRSTDIFDVMADVLGGMFSYSITIRFFLKKPRAERP